MRQVPRNMAGSLLVLSEPYSLLCDVGEGGALKFLVHNEAMLHNLEKLEDRKTKTN